MSTLTLAQANQIVAKALEKARSMTIKPVTVVVLDDALGRVGDLSHGLPHLSGERAGVEVSC